MSEMLPENPAASAQLRLIARRLLRLEQTVDRGARASQAAYRSVHLSDSTLKFYDDANLVGELSLSDGGGVVLKPVIDAPPPQPTPPIVHSSTNLLSVEWGGTFVGANRPNDLKLVEVHRGLTADFVCTDVTQCGEFTSVWGGIAVIPANLSDGTWYIKLVAVDLAGNESPPSAYDSGAATADTWV